MKLERAKSLLAAYGAKKHDREKPTFKLSPEVRMLLTLAVFDDRSAKWAYEFLVEEGELASGAEPKKVINQIRKVSGWISKIRVEDMKLPPLCKGLIQPPDMVKARKRWDDVNQRPSDEEILSGTWKGIAVDLSDLLLSPPHRRAKAQTAATKKGKPGRNSIHVPPPVSKSGPPPNAKLVDVSHDEEIPMNEQMQKFADEIDRGAPVYTPTTKAKSFHATPPTAFKH